MRKSRFLAALIALFLAAALPLVSTSGAQAVSGPAVAAKAKTKVTIKFEGDGAKSFKLYGKTKPKAKNKKATLLRSNSQNGNYKQFKTTKTNNKGKYSFGGLKKEGWYAVKVGNGVSQAKQICKGTC